MNLNELMATEELHLKKLHELVEKSIAEEQLLSSKLLEAEQELDITLAQKLADKIAGFGGLAALQAPVIMMSQNRQEDKDRRRARSDYMVNLKAEIEVRNLHSKMDLLITEQMKSLFEIQRTQLDLLTKMEKSLENFKKIESV